MRALLPVASDTVDLTEAYAYPADRPWLRANMVSSLDGAVSVEDHSELLSGPADKAVFGMLRDLCDVILVGAGTARAEGYQAVRRSEARVEQRRERGLTDVPAIAVVSGSLALDATSPLFVGARQRTLVVTTEEAAARRGADVAEVADVIATPGDRLDLAAAVRALHERGLRRLLCEGGPSLLGDLAAGGLLDELCLTISPLIAGGGARRIVTGPTLTPPASFDLAGLLEQDGFLFSRWVRRVH